MRPPRIELSAAPEATPAIQAIGVELVRTVMVPVVQTMLFAGRINGTSAGVLDLNSAASVLRGTAAAVAQAIPRRPRKQARVRARPDPAVAVLLGAPAGTYLLEQQGHRRKLSEGISGNEVPCRPGATAWISSGVG
jgi:hypothetical protein